MAASSNSAFVKPVRAARAYEELAAAIRARILAGDLSEGDRIPSEASLASDARVSRSTVREALRTLEEAGFLERASPKVLVVRQQAEGAVYKEIHRALERRNVTFRDVYEALLILEPEMVRLGTERATDADIDYLRENLEGQLASLDELDVWHQLSLEFHLALTEMAKNPALFVARASLSELLRPAVRLVYDNSEHTQRVYAFNSRILEEIAGHDPEAAAHASRKAILDFKRTWNDAALPFDTAITQLPGSPARF